MKKIFSMLMVVVVVFFLAVCGKTASNENSANTSDTDVGQLVITESADPETETSENTQVSSNTEAEELVSDGKTLVVYFSWSGNTQEMAAYIQEQTGADLLEIEPLNPYPTDYNECGDVAKREHDENARPGIANLPDSISEYDTIFIGYPIWWHTAPMIIGTFLENYDLSGVEIYPFTQSASMDTEQFENSMDFVRENADGATVHDGLFSKSSDTDAIREYLRTNGVG